MLESTWFRTAHTSFLDRVESFAWRHHTAGIALGLFLTWFAYQAFIYPRFLSPIRHLPGPPMGHWLIGQFGEIIRAEAGVLQAEWARKYAKGGNVVRAVGPFGIERVIFLTPKSMQQVLVDECYDFPRPDFVRNTLGEVTGHGLLTVEGDDHRAMRKMMAPAFTSAHLAQMVDLFWPPLESTHRVFQKEIKEAEEKDGEGAGVVMDVYEAMSRCTLDIICETAFGYSPNCQENHDDELAQAYGALIDQQSGPNLVMLILHTSVPLLSQLLHFLGATLPMKWTGPLGILDDSMKRINKISKDLLQKKTKSMTGEEAQQGKDVLSLLVAANKSVSGAEVLNESQMMDQVLTFLGAGHETTASGMTWTLLLLARHPEIQEKLRAECADLLGRRIDPDMEMLNALPYLEGVVKESLRLMPPVPMTFRKTRIAKTVEGVKLPANLILYIGNRVINTLPELWGDDAEEFKPERWIDVPENEYPGGSFYSFMSFIHGPHGCIGGRMSMLEMKAMLVQLLANYSFDLSEKDQKVIPTSAITMKPTGGLPLRVKKVKTFANEIS